MRILVISLAAVAALSTFALPAAAQPQSTVAASAQNQRATGATAARTPRARGSDRMVCMDVELSGSHVTRRVCRTEREWQARGELDAD